MKEKNLIIRIAKLKQSLRCSMVQNLPSEVVQKIEYSAIEHRVERWFTELHRREVNRRAILKGLILPGSRTKTRLAQNISDVIEIQEQGTVVNEQGASIQKQDHHPSEQVVKNHEATNQLMQELFSAEEDVCEVDDKGSNESSQKESDLSSTDSVASDSVLVPEGEGGELEDSIPLLIPQAPKRRASQKKMFRSRAPKKDVKPKEVSQTEQSTVSIIDDTQAEVNRPTVEEPENVQVLTPVGLETFAVIQDPELKLSPEPIVQEEEPIRLTVEEMTDALDENPTDVSMRMMRAAHHERERNLVLALSDYRKAAEQKHEPAWDAYIRMLLECNLKVRAAEAEVRRERS